LAGVGHLIRSGVAAGLAGTALVGHGATGRLAAAVGGWVAAHCRGSLACHFFDLEQWRHGDSLMWWWWCLMVGQGDQHAFIPGPRTTMVSEF